MTGAELITQERARQVQEEGWTQEHDAEYCNGEIIEAAVSYANFALKQEMYAPGVIKSNQQPASWPWDHEWWKPSQDPIRNLIKAGALIAAEIDRLQSKSAVPRKEQASHENVTKLGPDPAPAG